MRQDGLPPEAELLDVMEWVATARAWAVPLGFALLVIGLAWTCQARAQGSPTEASRAGGTMGFMAVPSSPQLTTGCTVASVEDDTGAVTVDWACVDKWSAEFESKRSREMWAALSVVLKAVRDGKAKAK